MLKKVYSETIYLEELYFSVTASIVSALFSLSMLQSVLHKKTSIKSVRYIHVYV